MGMLDLRLVRGNGIAFTVAAGSICLVIVWTLFALTPSSYGVVLTQIGAPDTGLVAGQARPIRMDEFGIWTPYFQASVRNRLERFNHTSFYGEDLRNINALPLRDWGIVFKPQLWAFFVLPPANAYGLYFGILMAAFIAGYFFLFRELHIDAEYAIAGSLLLFCSGFSQFWWTTLGPCLSFFPWVALVFLRRCAWYIRLPLFAYALATWIVAYSYPITILTCALALVVLTAALRSETLRSGTRLAAVAGGIAVGLGLTYWYFADLIRVVSHSAYPGHRVAPPGTVPLAVLVSQFWPAFTFTATDFEHLTWYNICEIGVAGSFFPILTVCALDYTRLRRSILDPVYRSMWRAFAIIGLAAGLATWWMAGRCPTWIGRLLYWDHFPANRLLFFSGLLLLMAAFIPWQRGMVAITPWRAAIFAVAGPIASAIVKMRVFSVPAERMKVDWVCMAFAGMLALATVAVSRRSAIRLMLCAVVGINALLFLRFNPLQSAYPIFDIPDSIALEQLNAMQSNTPGSYLAMDDYIGATLNGFGFRSVSHVLIRPQPEFFRKYFPDMERETFDSVFNRYAWVHPREIPIPVAPAVDEIDIPVEVFRPIRNLRHLVIESGDSRCPGGQGNQEGPFGLSPSSQGSDLVVEGWAPWAGESGRQTLYIRTNRPVAARGFITVRRPDIAEARHNYNFEKAGFRLTLSAQDHRPLSLTDLRITAADNNRPDLDQRQHGGAAGGCALVADSSQPPMKTK